jgi:hypothetical protein
VPEGEALDFGSGRFLELEAGGLAAAGRAAYVLVAGGLGERLGYKGESVLVTTCVGCADERKGCVSMHTCKLVSGEHAHCASV